MAFVLTLATTSCGFALRVESASPPPGAPPPAGQPALPPGIVPTPQGGVAAPVTPPPLQGSGALVLPDPGTPTEAEAPLPTAADLTARTPDTPTCAHLDDALTFGEGLMVTTGDDWPTFLDEAIAAVGELADDVHAGDDPAAAIAADLRSWRDQLDGSAAGTSAAQVREEILGYLTTRGSAVVDLLAVSAERCGLQVGAAGDLVKLATDAVEQAGAS